MGYHITSSSPGAGRTSPFMFCALLFGIPILVGVAMCALITLLIAWTAGLSWQNLSVAVSIGQRYGYWVVVALMWLLPTIRGVRLLWRTRAVAHTHGLTIAEYLALSLPEKQSLVRS